jgi:hypothetical protein
MRPRRRGRSVPTRRAPLRCLNTWPAPTLGRVDLLKHQLRVDEPCRRGSRLPTQPSPVRLPAGCVPSQHARGCQRAGRVAHPARRTSTAARPGSRTAGANRSEVETSRCKGRRGCLQVEATGSAALDLRPVIDAYVGVRTFFLNHALPGSGDRGHPSVVVPRAGQDSRAIRRLLPGLRQLRWE